MPKPERMRYVASSFVDLPDFIRRHRRLFVLTGAGCSTASGIPDHRDTVGLWKRAPPMTYQVFMGGHGARQRYWARSMVGWRHFGSVKPNDAHRALAVLEATGKSEVVLTQKVDRLHQAAGNVGVIDLHGRLDRVRCMGCEHRLPRDAFQDELERLNPEWLGPTAMEAPDGDADLDDPDFASFVVPPCGHCGGVQKPDVVFFGEIVLRNEWTQRWGISCGSMPCWSSDRP